MKIVYGLLSFLLLLKAGEKLYKFFSLLFTDTSAINTLVIVNAIFGFAVIIYLGYIIYKMFFKQPTLDQELDN